MNSKYIWTNLLQKFLNIYNFVNLYAKNHIQLFLLFTGYTLFALFEYLVVFSNMAFHLTAVWDFKSREVMVISCSEDKDFWLETQGLSALCTTMPPGDNSLVPVQEDKCKILFHICSWWQVSSPQRTDVRQIWNKKRYAHVLQYVELN